MQLHESIFNNTDLHTTESRGAQIRAPDQRVNEILYGGA